MREKIVQFNRVLKYYGFLDCLAERKIGAGHYNCDSNKLEGGLIWKFSTY